MPGYNPIDIGDEADDGTGDTPRAAAIKINAMFEELYGYLSPSGSPVNSSLPIISGSAITGQTLSASNGEWVGSPLSYAYQWTRAGVAITDATDPTYLLLVADEGVEIRCEVTATNASGSTTATSAAVTPVAPVITGMRFWGVSAAASLTNDQVLSLSSDTASSRAKTMDIVVASAAYAYYLYPNDPTPGLPAFGDLTDVRLGTSDSPFNSLPGFTKTTQFVTLSVGGDPVLYNVYRSTDQYIPGTTAHYFQ